MLAIIDIEISECNRDIIEVIDSGSKKRIHEFPPTSFRTVDDSVKYEVIKAERYRYPNGEERKIGMSHKVHKVLGLPLDCMSDMSNEIYSLQKSNKEITTALVSWQTRCEAYQNMTFWQRLKFLINKA